MVPFEILHKQSPDLSHLRVFGCLGYVTCLRKSDKFSPRALPAILLGYSPTQKSYIMLTLLEEEILVSRVVILKRDVFPLHHPVNKGSPMFPVLLLSSDNNLHRQMQFPISYPISPNSDTTRSASSVSSVLVFLILLLLSLLLLLPQCLLL